MCRFNLPTHMDKLRQDTFSAQVAEMAGKETAGDDLVPIDQKTLDAVAEGDPDPQFVTINAAVEGVSKNGRNYTRELIQQIADQINTHMVDGYKGHLTEAERATKTPDTETIWLGATVREKNGKAYLYIKGYVMPDAKRRRTYLRTCKRLGKNVAVSIFGTAEKAVYNAKQKAYDLVNFTLESVDWARSRAEGIPNDGTFVLASEMVTNHRKEEHVERDEVIKSLTADELKNGNPELVQEMQATAENGGGEMQELVTVQEMVGADSPEDAVKAVAEMQRENRSLQLDKELRKVRSQAARTMIRQMVVGELEKAEGQVNVAEMVNDVLASDEGKAIIAEHVDRPPKIDPRNTGREAKGQRRFTDVTK